MKISTNKKLGSSRNSSYIGAKTTNQRMLLNQNSIEKSGFDVEYKHLVSIDASQPKINVLLSSNPSRDEHTVRKTSMDNKQESGEGELIKSDKKPFQTFLFNRNKSVLVGSSNFVSPRSSVPGQSDDYKTMSRFYLTKSLLQRKLKRGSAYDQKLI
jgi:hypothetical protein